MQNASRIFKWLWKWGQRRKALSSELHRVGNPEIDGPRRGLSDFAAENRRVLIFFAPEAGLVPHYMANCLVAKAMQERGHRVLLVRCVDIYPRCVVMDAVGLAQEHSDAQRRAVCTSCVQSSVESVRAYGLDVIDLRDVLDEEMRRSVDRLMAHLPEDLSTFEVDGIRFGKICGAEAAVTFKIADFTGATPAVRALLLRYLRGALLSYLAMHRLIGAMDVVRVIHFNHYAILFAAALAARSKNIPATNMSMASIRGVDRRRITFLTEAVPIESDRRRLEEWMDWRNLALPDKSIIEIADDCIYRMSSNSTMIYSPVRTGDVDELFSRLDLSPRRRLLVAFTSSLDEIGANNQFLEALGLEPPSTRQPFCDQIEWLEALINYVEGSKELQLVVRVHPREDINRRDKVASSHLEILRQRFLRPFKHVKFVWPADPVSSYDLMELADIGLVAWSGTGLEMARLGVPVLIAFDRHTPIPIGDVVSWSDNRKGYFGKLHEALQKSPSLNQIRFAYRWSNLRLLGGAVDMGDVIPDSQFLGLPPYEPPSAARAIEDILIRGRDPLEINREALIAGQTRSVKANEQEVLTQQLRRCIWFLCFGEDKTTDYRLYFTRSQTAVAPSDYDAVLIADGEFIELHVGDRIIRRRSRMVQRLALLAGQNTIEVVSA
jgi:hypothetical protein